jgi:hypothetical protein
MSLIKPCNQIERQGSCIRTKHSHNTKCNWFSFKYCRYKLTSPNSYGTNVMNSKGMDICMKPVEFIKKPATHLILFVWDRVDSSTSLFLLPFAFAFRWRFFFAWIARTVKWKAYKAKTHFHEYNATRNNWELNYILHTSPIHIIFFNSVHNYYNT